MFCSNCGQKIESGAKFCSSCGTAVTKPATEPANQPVSPPSQTHVIDNQQQYSFLKKRKGCLISLGVVAFLFLALIILAILNGGEISFSTANISEAYMASKINPKTSEPLIKTDVFPKRTTTRIYATALVKNIPGKTKFSAIWYHLPSGSSIRSENDIITDKDMWLNFSLTNPRGFVAGDYKVEILINDKVKQTLIFKVE
ncbi:MAG: zinc-ribbon domain-containing protein [Syntrophaceae bacterium]|nr:zinc-ribbon domain-containing protein [Syntrophaceae bacterium]